MPIEKPFSPACERNQEVLLTTLKTQLRTTDKRILEIGSGTGQHAVFFGRHLPHITWQTADIQDNHEGIQMWLDEAGLPNVLSPIEYHIGQSEFPQVQADVVFSANVLHIISESLVQKYIEDLSEHLRPGTRVMFYGPFKYNGYFTSASNAEFDLWLKDIDPQRGIRDFEFISKLMSQGGLQSVADMAMPANNQFLIFEKA